jgi:hypothetical protein
MIKKGKKAWSKLSKKNEKTVREVVEVLIKEFEHIKELTWIPKLSKKQIRGGKGACAPDGGIFCHQNRLFLGLEAKYQGDLGNACERWCKNEGHLRRLDCAYLSFFSGKGAPEGRIMSEILNSWHFGHEGRWDKYEAFGNSTFRKEESFTFQEVYDIIKKAILLELEKNETDFYMGGWQE